jgi:glycosyltransferase involved in cell wall biosynthesis
MSSSSEPRQPLLRYSVLIPTIGRASLRLAFESIVAQTVPAAHIVIVADGHDHAERVQTLISTSPPQFDTHNRLKDHRSDGPLVFGDDLGRPVITVLSTDHHGAPEPARNAGLAVVRTPLVALLDDDDVWEPNKMAEQLPLFEDGVVAVAANATVVGDGRNLLYFEHIRKRLTFRHFLLRNPLIASTVTIRTEALRSIGGFPERPFLLDDYACWLRLATLGEVRVVDAPLIAYRAVDEASTSSRIAGRHPDPVAACLRETQRWARHQGLGATHRALLWLALVCALTRRGYWSGRRRCRKLLSGMSLRPYTPPR